MERLQYTFRKGKPACWSISELRITFAHFSLHSNSWIMHGLLILSNILAIRLVPALVSAAETSRCLRHSLWMRALERGEPAVNKANLRGKYGKSPGCRFFETEEEMEVEVMCVRVERESDVQDLECVSEEFWCFFHYRRGNDGRRHAGIIKKSPEQMK